MTRRTVAPFAFALAACGFPRPSLVDGSDGPDTSCGFHDIAVGFGFTCAIDRAGTVWCWGANADGQVSPGGADPILAATRVALPVGSVAVELALARQSACARLDDGTVWCWGTNTKGELGDGTTANHGPTQVLLGSERATALRAGGHHFCIVRASDQAIECWGANDYFALGNTGAAIQPMPAVVAGTAGTVQLAVGHRDGCRIDATGQASCWGRNAQGELGTNDAPNTARANLLPVTNLGATRAIAATGQQTCAIDTGGDVRCWGRAQLGDGTFNHNSATPSSVVDSNAIDLQLAPFAAWVVHGDGTFVSWGNSTFDGVRAVRTTPTASQLTGVSQLAAGFFHTCAIVNGTAMCWGSNGSGELGRGTRSVVTTTPMAVSLPGTVVAAASSSGQNVCALAGGKVFCWGVDDAGELGNLTLVASTVPLEVATGLATIEGVSMVWSHACAWGGGAARCWGDNTWGQIDGIAEPDPAHHQGSLPVDPMVSNVVRVATGQQFSCALTSAPAVECWGVNFYGQLGNGGAGGTVSPPAVVGNLTTPSALSTGQATACVIDSQKVKCWGDNRNGEIGDGTTMQRDAPVAVTLPGNQNAVELGVGNSYACALTPSGEVDCWGSNASGQLGQGDKTDRSSPTKVPLPPADPAVHLFVGWAGTCAKLTSGVVDCWGGVGLAATTSPIEVVALKASSLISIGGAGGCMQKQGQLSCWGTTLMLGNGDTSDWQALPVTLTCAGT